MCGIVQAMVEGGDVLLEEAQIVEKEADVKQHTDLSPLLHFIRYHETLIIDEIPGHVVGTSQISKSADKCVVRKFGVVC